MKYWMRIFIPAVMILLILLNGLLLIQRQQLGDLLVQRAEESEKQGIIEEAEHQANAVSRYMKEWYIKGAADRNEIDERLAAWRNAEPEEIRPIMEGYVKNQTFPQRGVDLRLYKYSAKNDGDTQKNFSECYRNDTLRKSLADLYELKSGELQVIPRGFNETMGVIMRELPDCPDYKLVFIQSITPKNTYDGVLNIIQIFGLAASALVVIVLLVSMRSLTKPVSELTQATREYAKGDRSQRLDPIGWDELAELASLFNSMADETRRLELVEEDAGRKQRFLDSFTHELRTPLTNIYGYSELMKRVQLSEEDRLRYLDYIMHESRRLNRRSEELFNLTVLRENTAQMDQVSCAALLDTVRQSLQEKAGRKGVSLVCENSDCTVYGNAALLESLCTNLAENAVRACGQGDEVRISVRAEDGETVLRVADTGMGIAPDQLEHITEPFYRVDKARSRAEGGVGLGLYLCSEIVRIHGAAMSFDSREGEGTTVTVRFRAEKTN